MFQNAIGMIQGRHQQYQNEPVDEQDAIRQHSAYYGGGGVGGPATAGGMGSAAAMQALKMFNQGGSSGGSSGGGSGQSQFVSMAMAQASKLFGKHTVSTGSSKDRITIHACRPAERPGQRGGRSLQARRYIKRRRDGYENGTQSLDHI